MFLLSYELIDNPNHEYELEFPTLVEAKRYLAHRAEFMVYGEIYTPDGTMVFDKDAA